MREDKVNNFMCPYCLETYDKKDKVIYQGTDCCVYCYEELEEKDALRRSEEEDYWKYLQEEND